MLINLENLDLLHTMYSAAFAKGLMLADISWEPIATTLTSNNKSNTYAWLGAMSDVREFLGDRVVAQLKGHSYSIVNKTWEKTISVDVDDIKDDAYGIYTPMAEQLGALSKSHRSRLMWELLAEGEIGEGYDGEPFFSATHPVGNGVQSNLLAGAGDPWYVMDTTMPLKPLVFQLREETELVAMTKPDDANVFWSKKFVWGTSARYNGGYGLWQTAIASKTALNEANLGAARTAMRQFKNDEGLLLGMQPTTLVVGASNEVAAMKLINNLSLATGETNINKGAYKLIVSPYLP